MLYFLSELSDGGDAFNLFRYKKDAKKWATYP